MCLRTLKRRGQITVVNNGHLINKQVKNKSRFVTKQKKHVCIYVYMYLCIIYICIYMYMVYVWILLDCLILYAVQQRGSSIGETKNLVVVSSRRLCPQFHSGTEVQIQGPRGFVKSCLSSVFIGILKKLFLALAK